MPVLDREPAVWPENLFDAHVECRQPDCWYAFHVRSRTEKAVARRLRSRGIAYFLPQYERRKRYQRRTVRAHLPLFPGYLFVLGNEHLLDALEPKEVVRSISVKNQRQIERELRAIHLLLQSGRSVSREARLRSGELARIVVGPLAGLCGQVVRNKRGLKFVLNVKFLQQGVSIEVDGSQIEAV